jgi:Heterokaryon incompatibility protein (HET)
MMDLFLMNKYGTGFPSSRELKLDKFEDVKEDWNTHDDNFAVMSMGFRLTHSMSKDDRATRIISSLIQGIGAKFYQNNTFFVMDLPDSNSYIAPRWALNFNRMRGVERLSSTLCVQIPQKRTKLSVPGWYMNENPLLRFIDAVYVCRRSTPDHLDKDLFSDVLGGTEERLEIHLHAILIAGLCILSVTEGPQLIEKLVNAILDLKADPSRHPVSIIPPTEWQILNRIKCDCNSPLPHRPLTPVAAAKAVGIQVWRNSEHETVTRAWDLINDSLVQNIDVSYVTFMTHKWSEHEVQYHDPLDQISTKSSKLQHIRDTLLPHTRYVWLDTICIDKANLSELDRTIRSMYKWYSNCQAVVLDSGTPLNDWCKRGWCLQEGAAAGILYGISKDDKLMSIQELAKEQSVNLCILDLHLYYRHGNAAEILARMDVRETTRKEDMTYALAGIFQIHLTASYGEGTGARGRLLHELAKKKGDLSFLSFPTVDTNALNHLPNPSDVNFLIATCIDTSTPANVSHCGICIEVQLVQGVGAKMVLGMLSRWHGLKIFHGKSSGIPELIATAERPEHRNSTDIELAIVHDIRSIILVQSYGEDLQTGGFRPIKLCFRLQCCQIEEDEFERLFGDLAVVHERIWLGSKPSDAILSRCQQKRKRRSTTEEQQVITFRELDSVGSNATDQELAAKRLKISLHDFLVDDKDTFNIT